MSFTWFNVTPDYNNQLVKYSSDNGKKFEDIIFPAGVKDYSDFDEHLKEITKTGDDENPVYPITLEFDSTDFHVKITLAENYQLDLTQQFQGPNRIRQKNIEG